MRTIMATVHHFTSQTCLVCLQCVQRQYFLVTPSSMLSIVIKRTKVRMSAQFLQKSRLLFIGFSNDGERPLAVPNFITFQATIFRVDFVVNRHFLTTTAVSVNFLNTNHGCFWCLVFVFNEHDSHLSAFDKLCKELIKAGIQNRQRKRKRREEDV